MLADIILSLHCVWHPGSLTFTSTGVDNLFLTFIYKEISLKGHVTCLLLASVLAMECVENVIIFLDIRYIIQYICNILYDICCSVRAEAAMLKYDRLMEESRRLREQYEAEERVLITETGSSSSQSNETLRQADIRYSEANISRSLEKVNVIL